MEEPNFWDNPEEAQEQMKQLSSMKEDRDTYQKLVSAKEDMETLIEMGQEEDDDSVVPEIAEMMEEFKASFDAIRIKTLLSGEFDKDNAIIKLNAGAGGTEACCTVCTPDGQNAKALRSRNSTFWTVMRPV